MNHCEISSNPLICLRRYNQNSAMILYRFHAQLRRFAITAVVTVAWILMMLDPAVAIDLLIESDSVKHNKEDDLMGLKCLLLLKPFSQFRYPKVPAALFLLLPPKCLSWKQKHGVSQLSGSSKSSAHIQSHTAQSYPFLQEENGKWCYCLFTNLCESGDWYSISIPILW